MAYVPMSIKSASSSSSSGITNIWTPDPNNKIRLMGYYIQLTSNCGNIAGYLTVKLKDGSADLGATNVLYVPLTSLATFSTSAFVGPLYFRDGIQLSAAGNSLGFSLSNTLSSGVVTVNAWLVEDPQS